MHERSIQKYPGIQFFQTKSIQNVKPLENHDPLCLGNFLIKDEAKIIYNSVKKIAKKIISDSAKNKFAMKIILDKEYDVNNIGKFKNLLVNDVGKLLNTDMKDTEEIAY